jgi:hypothetical protein
MENHTKSIRNCGIPQKVVCGIQFSGPELLSCIYMIMHWMHNTYLITLNTSVNQLTDLDQSTDYFHQDGKWCHT